jgi:hypothetical protein
MGRSDGSDGSVHGSDCEMGRFGVLFWAKHDSFLVLPIFIRTRIFYTGGRTDRLRPTIGPMGPSRARVGQLLD